MELFAKQVLLSFANQPAASIEREFMTPHISIPPNLRDRIQVDLLARSEAVRPTSARLPQRTCIRIAELRLRLDPDWLRKLFGRSDHSAMRFGSIGQDQRPLIRQIRGGGFCTCSSDPNLPRAHK